VWKAVSGPSQGRRGLEAPPIELCGEEHWGSEWVYNRHWFALATTAFEGGIDFRASGVSWLWTAHLISASKRTMLDDWPRRHGRTIWQKCSATLRETLTRPPAKSKLVRQRSVTPNPGARHSQSRPLAGLSKTDYSRSRASTAAHSPPPEPIARGWLTDRGTRLSRYRRAGAWIALAR
jgi:hypothetical protein